jgi:signal transduction histidine kinase
LEIGMLSLIGTIERGVTMHCRKHQNRLIAEVSHQINSPLAAIRNALYLAASRTHDSDVHRYLALANQEITSITNRIKELQNSIEGDLMLRSTSDAQPSVQKMRKAA